MEDILGLKDCKTCQWQRNPRDKIDPYKSIKDFHLLQISFNVKKQGKFTEESNQDPSKLWKAIKAFYQPRNLQKQKDFLNKVFSTSFSETKVSSSYNYLIENTQNLCNLIRKSKTGPPELIDSVIAI
ncbi:hypothetical protein O181_030366 [Austropuccinia psidii MF-1]|uniref:Uncharacterized protein n=1 Tax=Austropuccinia psidii MF-1 TaxID=1389203 RepID=A0A9Q3CSV8_9BASI|nr:hypothetical protein [Austropuccinia psidii MF-1]